MKFKSHRNRNLSYFLNLHLYFAIETTNRKKKERKLNTHYQQVRLPERNEIYLCNQHLSCFKFAREKTF